MPPRCRYNGPLGETRAILYFWTDMVHSVSRFGGRYKLHRCTVQDEARDNDVVNFDEDAFFSMHVVLISSCATTICGLIVRPQCTHKFSAFLNGWTAGHLPVRGVLSAVWFHCAIQRMGAPRFSCVRCPCSGSL